MKKLVWLFAAAVLMATLEPSAGLAQAQEAAGPDRALASSRSAQLRTEIEELEDARAKIHLGGPAAAGIAGYISIPLILVSPAFLLIDKETCGGCRDAGLVMTGLGALGMGVGIWGLVTAVRRSDERVSIDRKIKTRREELQSLSWDVKVGPRNVEVSFRF